MSTRIEIHDSKSSKATCINDHSFFLGQTVTEAAVTAAQKRAVIDVRLATGCFDSSVLMMIIVRTN